MTRVIERSERVGSGAVAPLQLADYESRYSRPGGSRLDAKRYYGDNDG